MVVLLIVAAPACTRTVGEITLRLLFSPNVDEKPLEGEDDLSIEVRVEGPGAGVHRATEPYVPRQTHVRVPEIEVGPDRVITVTVRNARGDDVARARSLPYDMTGEDVILDLYLSLVGESSEASTRLTAPRFRHTATPLPDGRILIAGGGSERVEPGWVEGLGPVPHAEIFDPTSGSVVTVVPFCDARPGGITPPLCLTCRRIGQVAGLDPEGAPVLAGGDTRACTFAVADRFAEGRFAPGPRIEPAVEEVASFDAADGIVVAGGLVANEPSSRALVVTGDDLSEIEDGLQVARYAATAAALPDGGGVVLGGFVSTPAPGAPPGCICEEPCDPEDPIGPPCRSRGTVTGSIEVYDPGSRTFEELPEALAEPRAYATATTLPDGRVVVVGGLGEALGLGGQNRPTASIEVFDPVTRRACSVATLFIPRWMHATVAASDRPDESRIVIFGGYESLGEISSTIEVIDVGSGCPSTARQAQVPSLRMEVRRAGHTATRMANGAILLAGGVTLLSQEDSEEAVPGVSDVLDVFWVE